MQLPNDHLSSARRAAQLLYSHGAKRVWMFGALASGHQQDNQSDIDLAVEGMLLHRLTYSADELGQMMGKKVDLVDMATAPPSLRPHILRTRVLLQRDVPDSDLVPSSKITL